MIHSIEDEKKKNKITAQISDTATKINGEESEFF